MFGSERNPNHTSKRALDELSPPRSDVSKAEKADPRPHTPPGKDRLGAMFEAGVATAARRTFTKYPDMPECPKPGADPQEWQRHWQESERIRAQGPIVSTSSAGTVRRTSNRAVHNRVR